MNKNKKINIFLKDLTEYYKQVNDDELFFYSEESKKIKSHLIGLKINIENDLNDLLGKNKIIEINSNCHINILSGIFSENYKESIYCLDLLIKLIKQKYVYKETQIKSKNKILALIKRGENFKVEFKSSLRWSYDKQSTDKKLEYVIAKSISSFMNSDGGKLLIGIKDNGEVLGIKKDCDTLKNKNIDGFLIELDQVINNYLGKDLHQYIMIDIIEIDQKNICVINIEKSSEPVYVKNNELNSFDFYIRASASSQPMNIKESNVYIRQHWDN